MDITVINQFEGPLDLLLHLIKESNIDIIDINIEDITKQYMNYISKMEAMSLDVASEYLVMAAELIEMKSRVLLPHPAIEDDEYEDDPREELIKRLIEYKNYKEMTPAFRDLEYNRTEYFTKEPSLNISGIDMTPKVSNDVNMDTFMDAFNAFLKKRELDKPLATMITNKEYSVSKRSNEIRELLSQKKRLTFNDLFENYNRNYIVVTFLSILTMAKNQELIIEQNNNFDELYICRRGD